MFLQGDLSSGLCLDDITFILMLFADDMVILGKDANDLQKSLDLLDVYCSRWGLQVNTDKTKILVFRKRGGLRDNETWTYKGSQLEVVNGFNYLGTVFKYTGSFVVNQETLVGKGLKALNCLLYTVSTMFASTFTLKLVILLANAMHAVKPSNDFLLALYRLIKT